MNRKSARELSLLCSCPSGSRSTCICVFTHRTSIHPVVHVAPPDVKHKGLNQVGRKSLAPKLLSTYRAARISPLDNIDSQRCLAFQHAPIVPQYPLYVYVNDSVTRPFKGWMTRHRGRFCSNCFEFKRKLIPVRVMLPTLFAGPGDFSIRRVIRDLETSNSSCICEEQREEQRQQRSQEGRGQPPLRSQRR